MLHNSYTNTPNRSRRGYGRSYGTSPSTQSWNAAQRPTDDPTIMAGLDPSPYAEIVIPKALGEHENVEPKHLRPVASYNWTDRDTPTIIVPGCPEIWQNVPTPFQLARDSGKIFVDQNKHRLPSHPLLPLFAAVEHMEPDFSFASIDIVSDRNNLRKLNRWAEGSTNSKGDFRIDLQLVGSSTVLFVRHESISVEPDPSRLGYGRNFEKKTTKSFPGCEEGTAHHRIITYDLSGMKILLRFEVDACLDAGSPAPLSKGAKRSNVHQSKAGDVDELSSLLGLLSVKKKDPELIDQVEIISSGTLVEQNSLIEMTTRSERSMQDGLDWQEHFPQLFLSQTPHHYLGVHVNGLFRRITHRMLKDHELVTQQGLQQPAFDKLRVLLQQIQDMVIKEGREARLSLVYKHDTRTFKVFRRTSSANALPDDWMRRLNTLQKPITEKDGESKPTEVSQGTESGTIVSSQASDGKTVVDSQNDDKKSGGKGIYSRFYARRDYDDDIWDDDHFYDAMGHTAISDFNDSDYDGRLVYD